MGKVLEKTGYIGFTEGLVGKRRNELPNNAFLTRNKFEPSEYLLVIHSQFEGIFCR